MIKLNRQYQGAKLAPHKPLLLLLAIGSWQQKRLLNWLVIKEELGSLLVKFGGVSNAKPVYPFIRLQNDGWWEVEGYEGLKGDATVPELDRANPKARLSYAFQSEFLTSKSSLQAVVKELLSEFEESVHQELLNAVGIDLNKHSEHPDTMKRQFFWVNQGKTYDQARSLECLWAPHISKSGGRLHHWDLMDNVNAGDMILTYSQSELKGFCVAKSSSFDQAQPELGQSIWGASGRMVQVEYFPFPSPLPIKSFAHSILNMLPNKYSPLKKSGTGANEGYLYAISDKVFAKVMELAQIDWASTEHSTEGTVSSAISVPSGPTEKLVTASRRVTQPQFRMNLIKRWNGLCSVTGCSELGVLTASHIVPWRHATDVERNDPDNGLLLSPVYDRLFDKEFITFDIDGKIKLGRTMRGQYEALGVTGKERINGLTDGHQRYLERHRAMLR